MDKVFTTLTTGGGETGQDFKSSRATVSFVAAGEFASDHGRTQLAFGQVIGGIHSGPL